MTERPDPPRAAICCVREATEPEGSGHDVDCPGPGVVPSSYLRDKHARTWRGPEPKKEKQCESQS